MPKKPAKEPVVRASEVQARMSGRTEVQLRRLKAKIEDAADDGREYIWGPVSDVSVSKEVQEALREGGFDVVEEAGPGLLKISWKATK